MNDPYTEATFWRICDHPEFADLSEHKLRQKRLILPAWMVLTGIAAAIVLVLAGLTHVL